MAHSTKWRARIVRSLAFAALASAAAVVFTDSTVAQTLPANVKLTCTIPSGAFNGWFNLGHPTVNGVVHEANGLTFPNTTLPPGSPPLNTINCNFYQWSKQMFMWLTSPAPATYGGGKYIFASSTFFGISPANPTLPSSGNRSFVAQGRGPFLLAARLPQFGPHDLPVVTDKTGHMFEVKPLTLKPGQKLQVLNTSNKLITVEHAVRVPNAPLQLIGTDKKPVQVLRANAVPGRELNLQSAIQAHRFSGILSQVIIDHIPIFIDPTNHVVETEEGQAGGGNVLVTQATAGRPTGTIAYYLLQVNDVYAYFLTGNKTGAFSASTFPTTAAGLLQVTNYAATKGKHFPDPNALAVEVKSSWVEASTLPNPQDYVTMMATIPVYNQPANSNSWTPVTGSGGSKTVLMAMLGMHVVGSTNGHPEMIWATFEHDGNAPDNCYGYVNTASVTVSVPPLVNNACPMATATTGSWTLTPSGATTGFNPPIMVYNSGTGAITSTAPAKNGPLPVLRWQPWGADSNATPNPLVPTAAASNTEVISMNVNINSLMGAAGAGADVRDRYMLIGATWTAGGGNPGLGAQQVGTSVLNNATMETFQQGTNGLSGGGGANCFSCHQGSGAQPSMLQNANGGISHIYFGIVPNIP
jgi:hypothetical protein